MTCDQQHVRGYLGAGQGLTSVVLARCGYDVVATDKSPVLGQLRQNLSRFKRPGPGSHSLGGDEDPASGEITVMELDWAGGDLGECGMRIIGGRPVDVIVLSDCVYSSA